MLAKVARSVALTPKKRPAKNRDVPNAAGAPIRSPISIISTPRASTRRVMRTHGQFESNGDDHRLP